MKYCVLIQGMSWSASNWTYRRLGNNYVTTFYPKDRCRLLILVLLSPGGCQYEINKPEGVITSPNWPNFYPARKDCVWHFTTKPGHRVKLSFREFGLEPHQECTYDHIVVFDGDDTNARSLGVFCGSAVPEPITSSGNTMFMVFYSDASVQRKGFEAEYQSGEALAPTPTPSPPWLFRSRNKNHPCVLPGKSGRHHHKSITIL